MQFFLTDTEFTYFCHPEKQGVVLSKVENESAEVAQLVEQLICNQ